MLTPKLVTTQSELAQIAELSALNLITNISSEQKEKEGFVTWVYPLETLQALHDIVPSVIVMDGEKLAGYAITLTKECAAIYPPLEGDLKYFAKLPYKGRILIDYPVYFMGQICVDIAYRGQGVVKMLYDYHRQEFSKQFDLFVTMISPKNPRSLKAHQKVGFKVIDRFVEGGQEWDAVVWDWTEG